MRIERSRGTSARLRRSAVARETRTPVQSSPVRCATDARSNSRPSLPPRRWASRYAGTQTAPGTPYSTSTSTSTSASPWPARVTAAHSVVPECASGVSVEARESRSTATSSSCRTCFNSSSISRRRACEAVSRASTNSARASQASTGVRRCGESSARGGGTGRSAATSSISPRCRSRRARRASTASRSRSTSRRSSPVGRLSGDSASATALASVTRTPSAPTTRTRSEPGSAERGRPVTRTRPSRGTVPRASRRQRAPCAYTTTESSVDAHLGTASAFMCSPHTRCHSRGNSMPDAARAGPPLRRRTPALTGAGRWSGWRRCRTGA